MTASKALDGVRFVRCFLQQTDSRRNGGENVTFAHQEPVRGSEVRGARDKGFVVGHSRLVVTGLFYTDGFFVTCTRAVSLALCRVIQFKQCSVCTYLYFLILVQLLCPYSRANGFCKWMYIRKISYFSHYLSTDPDL